MPDSAADHDPVRGLKLRGQPNDSLAKRAGHGGHRVLGNRGDRGDDPCDPITRPAESALKTCTSRPEEVMHDGRRDEGRARRSRSTTVGTPTRTSSTGLITSAASRARVLQRGKWPSRARPGSRPAPRSAVTSRVPLISGQMPNWGSAKSGFQSPSLMNAHTPTSSKNLIVSPSSEATMPERRQHRDHGGREQPQPDRLLAPATASGAEDRSPRRRVARALVPVSTVGAPPSATRLAARLLDARTRPRCLGAVHGDDLRLLGDRLVVVHHVLHVRLHLRPGDRVGARVHEQRP